MTLLEISLVSITDGLIASVAKRCKVTEDRVRRYVDDKDDQDNDLLRAFLFFGVSPMNKWFKNLPAVEIDE